MRKAINHRLTALLPALARAAVLAAAMFSGSASAGDPAVDDLHRLMQHLAARQHGRATYTERQFIAVLDRPLDSSGELLFDAPDHLEKRTLLPKAESITLERSTVTFKRGTKTRTLSLSDYPQFGPVIEAMRAAVGGDLATLEQHYVVTFTAEPMQWSLTLAPRDPAVAAQVAMIKVSGQNFDIREIEINRTGGDRSVMTIHPLPDGG